MNWRTTPRQGDVSAVRALVAATGFFSAEEQQVAAELVQETLARGSASGYEFVFVDAPAHAETLLAYACFGLIPATLSSYELYWIAVTPAQQGSGLGGRLLQETERRAHAAGATRIYLDTSGRAQYTPTRAFYERKGYRVAARLEDFFAPGDDKVIYTRTL